MATNIQASVYWMNNAALCCARPADALFNVVLERRIGADVAIFVAGACPLPLLVLGGWQHIRIGGIFVSVV